MKRTPRNNDANQIDPHYFIMDEMPVIPLTKAFRITGIVSNISSQPAVTIMKLSYIGDNWEESNGEIFKVYLFDKAKEFADKYVAKTNAVDVSGILTSSTKPNNRGEIFLRGMHMAVYKIDAASAISLNEAVHETDFRIGDEAY